MTGIVLAIVGPTASGKTALAVKVARRLDGQILNADSMQVYRGLDAGTAKPTPEQRNLAKFHMLDVAEPSQRFSAKAYADMARPIMEGIISNGMTPIVCGGTGLYIKALFRGLFEGPEADLELRRKLMQEEELSPGSLHRRLAEVDPESARRISRADSVRVVRALEVYVKTGRKISELRAEHGFSNMRHCVRMVGLCPPRHELYRRIDERVDRMFEAGLVEEVRGLLARGLDPTLPSLKAIGYRQVVRHINGEYDLHEAVRLVKRDTRRLAKRQLTWFRAEPEVRWLEKPSDVDGAIRLLRIDRPEAH